MDTNELLKNIDELISLYLETGNRKVLTNLRRAVTVATKTNRVYDFRIEELFANYNLSIDLL